jgi:PAS domain S-box-containing protein
MQKHFKSIIKKQSSIIRRDADSRNDDILRRLAFDGAAQPYIITIADSGKMIMTNRAAAKLLGYSKKELLTRSRDDIFDSTSSIFKKMLKQRTAEWHSRSLVTAVKRNGKAIVCEIISAVFIGQNGIKNAITTITDMSESILNQKRIDANKENIVAMNIGLAESKQSKKDVKLEKKVAGNILLAQVKFDTRLAEKNEWIRYISKASYDVMWDWDIATGKIYVGDSVKEVFGYTVKNKVVDFSDFTSRLLKEDRPAVEKRLFKALASASRSWDDTYRFRCNNGSFAFVSSRASIIRNGTGKAIRLIGAIQDVSRLQELEMKLEGQSILQKKDRAKFLLAAKLSFDVIWDWNLLTNEVFLGDGFEELFGYAIKNNEADMIKDWVNNLHPDDRKKVIAELQVCIKSTATDWEHAYRVSRADGSIAKVYVRASIFRHADGKAYRMIGALQDLSRQKALEEKLEHEIRLKGKQIAEAEEDARESERSEIGKELHDNINQLLGASRMYVEMAKKEGVNKTMYLDRASEYTLNAIDEIRILTKGLTCDIVRDLGLGDAIKNAARDIMEVSQVTVSCSFVRFEEASVSSKFKQNIFRIVQEQLNNILKYANAKKVLIKLTQNKKNIILTITDNGIGFDVTKKSKGIGIENIKSRAAALNGKADFVTRPGSGCTLTITLPL